MEIGPDPAGILAEDDDTIRKQHSLFKKHKHKDAVKLKNAKRAAGV